MTEPTVLRHRALQLWTDLSMITWTSRSSGSDWVEFGARGQFPGLNRLRLEKPEVVVQQGDRHEL
jgi:hypothetical protein